MTAVLTPLITLTEWTVRPFKREGGKRRMTIADLRTMADLARSERLIGAQEESIIINAIRLRQMTVSAVMVPRERIVMFDTRRSNVENFETVAFSLHTRYPVRGDGSVDGIIGYVNLKEIVAIMPSRREARIQPYIRPLSRIPVDASLNNALRTLLARREQLDRFRADRLSALRIVSPMRKRRPDPFGSGRLSVLPIPAQPRRVL
jgi:CBS domain containing-hemolysin-like protein